MNYDLLREMLRRHEGLRLKPYRCPAGFWTIGYGWNIQANELPPDIKSCLNVTCSITQDMAERLLNISIDTAERQCKAIFQDFSGFSDARQVALVDWIFNIGIGTAMKFKKAMAAIKAGNWGKAADEMKDSAWFKQVGNRGIEIVDMVREG